MLTINQLDLFLELVYIPGGSFQMGSEKDNREKPIHKVNIQPFYMSKYLITQRQYQEIMEINPSNFKEQNLPVEKVSWNDATEFCEKLSEITEGTYSLPSESQWEYACRAGTTTPYYFGESITTELANYNGSDDRPPGENRTKTTEVGIFPPNAFGLYDMHGNVYEWCEDIWHDDYNEAPDDGSAWLEGGYNNNRVFRGGSWGSIAGLCRSAYRDWDNADDHINIRGFRIVYVPSV
ncbi:formylglycine-generating enzyme family protein [Okeania sp. KiyG1]|uniref:formylglycine-generating enzyme family protein n=1 Tax=Okeania sp. KiyG1 TaxID=2720165 RepID=UPI0019246F0A|nr:formylglycine-generating enzyme family protein [Okeania sp. KiyG1]GGA02306.1 hypothetical protein CYANOKiyG1_14330 [Okeania sp. KiyG1]